ncbi:hypothetical protein [Kibdelosporangium philippinense]|uniref:hypothetical protein n=1 Tax=Kibdelosporangium philippinense TaxID=211113 RepID=UPI0036107D3A
MTCSRPRDSPAQGKHPAASQSPASPAGKPKEVARRQTNEGTGGVRCIHSDCGQIVAGASTAVPRNYGRRRCCDQGADTGKTSGFAGRPCWVRSLADRQHQDGVVLAVERQPRHHAQLWQGRSTSSNASSVEVLRLEGRLLRRAAPASANTSTCLGAARPQPGSRRPGMPPG